jgi:hypothetical protein
MSEKFDFSKLISSTTGGRRQRRDRSRRRNRSHRGGALPKLFGGSDSVKMEATPQMGGKHAAKQSMHGGRSRRSQKSRRDRR